MCTVTFLPKAGSDFILTHNRDEHHLRSLALLPDIKVIHNTSIITPTDTKAGGTWIAVSKDYTLCLLNGGLAKHKHSPPYRHSRGKIIPDFFQFGDVVRFASEYDLQNIEPFTLIIVDNNNKQVNQLIYDESKIHHEVLTSHEPHIWSSTTLYSADDIKRRKAFFDRFLQKTKFTQEDIIKFHTNNFEEYESEGIQINRNNILKTVSLTSISKSDAISMYYEDFIQNQSITIDL